MWVRMIDFRVIDVLLYFEFTVTQPINVNRSYMFSGQRLFLLNTVEYESIVTAYVGKGSGNPFYIVMYVIICILTVHTGF